MNKYFHDLVLGVSVLPALLIMPALANSYTGHTGIQGALSDATGANISMSEAVVFSDNTTTDHGAGFYYKNGGTNSSVVFGSNVTFANNEVLSSATSGSGAGMFVSGGNVSLLGDINTFTSNEMNATVAEGRKVKVGGGAIANQSYEKDMNPDKGTALDAIMVIGNSNSINTFTSNTSVTNGGAIMNRAMDDDGNASLTINGKTEFTGNHADINGGAIYNYQADGKTANVNLNNGNYTFTSNTATKNGGAIYNNGKLFINNANFSGNTAVEGGAVYSRGQEIYTTDADLSVTEIRNSTFSGNVSNGDVGNAITVGKNSKLILRDSSFDSNITDTGWGGAVFSYAAKPGSVGGLLDIVNVTFTNNSALGVGALGVFSEATLKNLTFKNNHATDAADDGAGAVFFGSVSQSDMLLSNSLFESNTSASVGGAIATRGSGADGVSGGDNTDALLDVSDVTFVSNTAGTKGGAIYNAFHGSTKHNGYITLSDAKFLENVAADGGAIYNSAAGSKDSVGGQIYGTNLTFLNNSASGNGGAIYNNVEFVLAGTNTFTGNKANNVANDIHNVGTLNIVSGTTTMDGGITGDGDLTIANGATLNIGKAIITQGSIDLNGTLIAELVSDSDSIFNAATFESSEDTGKLSLAIEKAGTYNLFGNAIFDKAQEQVTSTVYDLDWSTNEGKTVIATVKAADKIAEETGVSTDAATAISHVAESESKQLQDLSLKMQEKLAENTPEAKAAVEHAAKAVHPEKESVVQSVSTSVQNTVVNLASARMATPIVGRSGGDVEFTKGGVWAQGLFNKSKQADAFNGYTRGIALGLDGTINKDWTIGAGYSYAHSDISGTARDTKINSNTIFLYGQYKPAEWYVNAIANYTMSDYSERGTILDSIAVTGDYKVNSFGGALTAGYDFDTGITPELGLRYMHVNANDYANSYGIKTHMDASNFLTGVIGARYAFDVAATKYMTFAPQLSAAMKYDMLSDKNVATVTMPGVNAYTIDGNRLNRFGGEFGIGLGMQYRELNVSVNYDIDVRKDYTSQTGMLKFRYNF